jgi:hypothetical protein
LAWQTNRPSPDEAGAASANAPIEPASRDTVALGWRARDGVVARGMSVRYMRAHALFAASNGNDASLWKQLGGSRRHLTAYPVSRVS